MGAHRSLSNFCSQQNHSNGAVKMMRSTTSPNVSVFGVKKHPSALSSGQTVINQKVGICLIWWVCAKAYELSNFALQVSISLYFLVDNSGFFMSCLSLWTLLCSYWFCCPAECWRFNEFPGGRNFPHIVVHVVKGGHSLKSINPLVKCWQLRMIVFVG